MGSPPASVDAGGLFASWVCRTIRFRFNGYTLLTATVPYEVVNMDDRMDEACHRPKTQGLQYFLVEGQFPPAPLNVWILLGFKPIGARYGARNLHASGSELVSRTSSL